MRGPNGRSAFLFGLLVGAGGLVVWQQLAGHPIFPPNPIAARARAAATKHDMGTTIVPVTVAPSEATNGPSPENRVPEHWQRHWFNGQPYYIIPCNAPRGAHADAPCD